MFKKRGSIAIDKILIVIIVIAVIVLIFGLLIKFDLIGNLNLLPSFSSENSNVINKTDNEDVVDAKIINNFCEMEVGSIRIYLGRDYIIYGTDFTDLYIEENNEDVFLQLRSKGFLGFDFVSDLKIGKVVQFKEGIKSFEIYEEEFDKPKFKKYLDSQPLEKANKFKEILSQLENVYFFNLVEGKKRGILCTKKTE